MAHRVETFAYDELYRLRRWTNTSGGVTVAREFRYDPIGVRQARLVRKEWAMR